MHGIEDLAALNTDLQTHLVAQLRQLIRELRKAAQGDIHDHDHVEHAGQNGLRDIQNIGLMMRERSAHARDDADGIVRQFALLRQIVIIKDLFILIN